MPRALLAWGPAIAQMTAIFIASSFSDIGPLPGGLSDYSWHFMAYSVLGACLIWAFASARWMSISMGAAGRAFIASTAYGASDEFHQSFVLGRTPDVNDWLADTAGAAVAILVILMIARATRGRRPSSPW